MALTKKRFAAPLPHPASPSAKTRSSGRWNRRPGTGTGLPLTFRYVSSILYDLFTGFRCGRHRLLISGAYACTQRQMQLASTSSHARPTAQLLFVRDGYRRYHLTASRITSPGYWRPLNGCVGVTGIGFYPIRAKPESSQRNLYDLVLLWHAKSGYLSAPQSAIERLWYKRKMSVSFEDNLRQATWQGKIFGTPDWMHKTGKSFSPL